jgi:surface polysaccharide O-acyltransferase-like enzyme
MFIIVFYHLLLTPNLAAQRAFYAVVHIAAPCFVLISGYWGIRASVKGLLDLFTKCIIYTVSLYLAYCVAKCEVVSIKDLIKTFVSFYPRYWFIGTYIGLYLISPIINIPLKIANKKQKLVFIAILGMISFWLGWAGAQHTMADGKNIANMIFIYYLGDFLRYNIDHDKVQSKKIYLLLAYIILNVGLVVTFLSTGKFELFQKIVFRIFFPYNSPGLIVNAMLCFLLFSTIKIRSQKINWLASSALSIYLIHYGLLLGLLVEIATYIRDSIMGGRYLLFWLALGLFSLTICIACIMLDKLIEPMRKYIVRIVYNKIGLYKIDNFMK